MKTANLERLNGVDGFRDADDDDERKIDNYRALVVRAALWRKKNVNGMMSCRETTQ